MPPAVHVREACTEDISPILAFETAGFAEDAFSRRQIRYLITRAKGICLAALHNGTVVGYIAVLTSRRHRNGRIYSLAVAPDFRRMGIAGLLIDTVIEYAQRTGLKTVSLEVRLDNQAAITLYKKKQFMERSVKRAYYHDGTNACRMVLPIPIS